MVIRCKGVSHDGQDQKNAPSTGNRRAYQKISFILTIHSCSYVEGLEHFVKQIDGVERVKGDGNYIKLEVMGKVDPYKIREMVEHETKKKVDLCFPLSEIQGVRDEKKVSETKLKKQIMPMKENDVLKAKPEESIIVLKIKLCCDSCNHKLEKFLKIKGLEMLTKDVDKELITLRGTVDVAELKSYIKDKLKKDVEVVYTVAVMLPAKTDDSAANQKDEGQGEGGDAMTKSRMVVLKMRLHCDGCNKKVQKIISKIRGVEKVSIKADKNLITVKGTMDVEELVSSLKEKIKSDIDVVPMKK